MLVVHIVRYITCTTKTQDSPSRSSWLVIAVSPSRSLSSHSHDFPLSQVLCSRPDWTVPFAYQVSCVRKKSALAPHLRPKSGQHPTSVTLRPRSSCGTSNYKTAVDRLCPLFDYWVRTTNSTSEILKRSQVENSLRKYQVLHWRPYKTILLLPCWVSFHTSLLGRDHLEPYRLMLGRTMPPASTLSVRNPISHTSCQWVGTTQRRSRHRTTRTWRIGTTTSHIRHYWRQRRVGIFRLLTHTTDTCVMTPDLFLFFSVYLTRCIITAVTWLITLPSLFVSVYLWLVLTQY